MAVDTFDYPVPENEAARLQALRSYNVLDTSPEICFDELSELAALVTGCPAAYISLVDDTRQWMKSLCNLPAVVCEVSREYAMCSRTICQHDVIQIEDLQLDERFKDSPFVTGVPYFRYYCGAPLINSQGYALGSLCVVDFAPRKLGHKEREALRQLSHQVVSQLEMRRSVGALQATQHELEKKQDEVELLMRNVMPASIAHELREHKSVEPRFFPNASILFTDFFGFTKLADSMAPRNLVDTLDQFFSAFDGIVTKHRMERLKTIGDAYMCVAGMPDQNRTHPMDACLAALEMRAFMSRYARDRIKIRLEPWEMRVGINTGPVVGGIIGQHKFAYDIWGHAVNIASRMESAGEPGRINVSENTHDFVKHLFDFEERGSVEIKNAGAVPMFFLERIKPELSADPAGTKPNDKFWVTPPE
jgi:adenylate cyclase